MTPEELEEALRQFRAHLEANQTPLDAEAAALLRQNLWELYETDEASE